MPLLALKKLHTVRTFSGADELDKNLQWTVAKAAACAQKQIPEAYKMLVDAAPRDEGTDTGRFVVTSQEREALLMQWASGYSHEPERQLGESLEQVPRAAADLRARDGL